MEWGPFQGLTLRPRPAKTGELKSGLGSPPSRGGAAQWQMGISMALRLASII
jgi:hypothetical protein